jgi:hypothetical protein
VVTRKEENKGDGEQEDGGYICGTYSLGGRLYGCIGGGNGLGIFADLESAIRRYLVRGDRESKGDY